MRAVRIVQTTTMITEVEVPDDFTEDLWELADRQQRMMREQSGWDPVKGGENGYPIHVLAPVISTTVLIDGYEVHR